MTDPGPLASPAVPARLDRLNAVEAGRQWLRELPHLAEECGKEWSLRLGAPFTDVTEALVVPAESGAGGQVVLKIQFPGRETEHEAAALAHWDGDGAIKLLAHDPKRHAMLLERCVPGSPLSEVGADAAIGVFIDLLPRLWKAAGAPFTPLAEEAAWWASYIEAAWERAGRPYDRRLIDAALEALRSLPDSQGQQVLVHQDLHADNVLSAERYPWLVIDPKPLVGEREFGVAPIVRSNELGHGRSEVRYRLDRLTAELGLDRERARLWSLAQTVAWSFEGDGYLERHIETARWLLEIVRA